MRALVLCAGFGTRLGGLTRHTPKPLLPVAGRPLLEHIVRNLARHGFTEIAVNLHFQPEAIRECLGDGSRLGVQVVYSYEPELLGTAGGTKKLAAFLGRGGPFLVHYGDVLTNQDLTALHAFHLQRKALCTALVHRRAKSNSAVSLDAEGRVRQFLERPTDQQRDAVASPWVFSGIALCNPELPDLIPAATPCDFPRDVFTTLVDTGKFYGFPLSGARCAVDSPQRLEEAQTLVRDWERQ